MKVTVIGILTLAVSSVSAFDITTFGARAVQNLNRMPACAQLCIFNPKLAWTYAPECSDLPLGREYAKRLCQNYMYQHMLDNCFKENCNDNERKRVSSVRMSG